MEQDNVHRDVPGATEALPVDEQNRSVALDEKTVVLVSTDVGGENASQQIVQTLPVATMEHSEQAEITIFTGGEPPLSTAGTSQAYVYTSEAPFMTTVEPLTVAAATEHAAPVGVALVSNQAGLHAPGHGNEPSLVSVTNAPTGTVIATSASASIASTTNLSKADHSTVPTAAITNAQIVTARACPATVQWLIENFETAEGISLPRSTLYHFYLRHCSATKLDAVNAASFGKLIRSVFLGLRTRRLGTRGNSKYHYYGIRIKPSSPLADLPFEDYVPQSQRSSRYRTPSKDDSFLGHSFSTPTAIATPSSAGKSNPLRHDPLPTVSIPQATEQQQEQFQQFLALDLPLPTLPDCVVAEEALPDGVTQENLIEFSTLYKEHCEELVNVIRNFQFHLLETLWKQFWSQSDSSANGAAAAEVQMDTGDDTHRLPGPLLLAVSQCEGVRTFVQSCDNLVYQNLVDMLMPEVLRPIPSQLTQTVRNLSKNLETWLGGSMSEVPEPMANVKMTAVSALSQTLRRYTSLNHLAQAARAVLQNSGQITQMLNDLLKVDFQSIQEQASWVCQCDEEKLLQIQNDFKSTLQTQQPLEEWANWMERLVDDLLSPVFNTDKYVKAARKLLLKWSFYSSMIIRDLTLRSAASFGSFHLIRLLYDEYMFFVVEHRVAKDLGRAPVAVLGEFVQLGRNYCAEQEEQGSFAALGDNTMAELNPDGESREAASAPAQGNVIVPLVA